MWKYSPGLQRKSKLSSKEPATEVLPASQFLGRAQKLAEDLVESLNNRKKRLVLAESCTGGLSSDYIVRVPGASRVFWGSFVAYTDEAKIKMLEVPEGILKEQGAVSREAALAMAEGALKKSRTDLAVSITGFAGPDEGGVPTGTIWIALAGFDEGQSSTFWSKAKGYLFTGKRNEIRQAAAAAALEWALKRLSIDKKGRGDLLLGIRD